MQNLQRESWKVWILAGIVFLNGILDIGRVLTTRFSETPRLFNAILPFQVHHLGRSLTLIFGFFLVYFSFNLLWRKKVAWYLVTLISFFSIVIHIIGRNHFTYVAISSFLLPSLLIVWRKIFIVRSESTSIVQGLSLMFLILALAMIYGTLGFWLLDAKDFRIDFNVGDSVVRAFRQYAFLGNADLIPYTRHARWFLDSFSWLGITTLVLAIYSLFQPVKYRLLTLPAEVQLAKEILKKYGRSFDDYFKTSSDKTFFFSSDKKSFIAYKNVMGVAAALNDPAGPPEDTEEITKSFLRFCFENGWKTIFINVLPDFIEVYKKLGFRVVKIGEEAVINLESFCDVVARTKPFRKIKNRFEREGYKTALYSPPNPQELVAEMEEVSDEWLKLPGRKERGFALGSFGRDYVKNTPLFVVRNSAGQAIAFVNQIPSYGKGKATIDLMRHRINVPNNTMEYLFSEFFKTLKEEGYKEFSLGLATFTGIGEKQESGFEEKALRRLSKYLNRFFSYKGLRAFKEKFKPNWEERFVVYHGNPANLLRIVMAASKAIGL